MRWLRHVVSTRLMAFGLWVESGWRLTIRSRYAPVRISLIGHVRLAWASACVNTGLAIQHAASRMRYVP
jgi:hypothetical protein